MPVARQLFRPRRALQTSQSIMTAAAVDGDLREFGCVCERQCQRRRARLEPSLPPAGIGAQAAENAALENQRRPATRFAAIGQQNEAVVLLLQSPPAGDCSTALAGSGDVGRLQSGGDVVDTGQRPDRRQQRRVRRDPGAVATVAVEEIAGVAGGIADRRSAAGAETREPVARLVDPGDEFVAGRCRPGMCLPDQQFGAFGRATAPGVRVEHPAQDFLLLGGGKREEAIAVIGDVGRSDFAEAAAGSDHRRVRPDDRLEAGLGGRVGGEAAQGAQQSGFDANAAGQPRQQHRQQRVWRRHARRRRFGRWHRRRAGVARAQGTQPVRAVEAMHLGVTQRFGRHQRRRHRQPGDRQRAVFGEAARELLPRRGARRVAGEQAEVAENQHPRRRRRQGNRPGDGQGRAAPRNDRARGEWRVIDDPQPQPALAVPPAHFIQQLAIVGVVRNEPVREIDDNVHLAPPAAQQPPWQALRRAPKRQLADQCRHVERAAPWRRQRALQRRPQARAADQRRVRRVAGSPRLAVETRQRQQRLVVGRGLRGIDGVLDEREMRRRKGRPAPDVGGGSLTRPGAAGVGCWLLPLAGRQIASLLRLRLRMQVEEAGERRQGGLDRLLAAGRLRTMGGDGRAQQVGAAGEAATNGHDFAKHP